MQAKSLLQEQQELLSMSSMRLKIWEEIDELFVHHRVSPWTAAQFYVHQAAEPASAATLPENEDSCFVLKVTTFPLQVMVFALAFHNFHCYTPMTLSITNQIV